MGARAGFLYARGGPDNAVLSRWKQDSDTPATVVPFNAHWTTSKAALTPQGRLWSITVPPNDPLLPIVVGIHHRDL